MSVSTALTRRSLLLASCASMLASAPLRSRAQRSDTLRIVCGYPPGGSLDVVSRKLAEKLAGRVGGNVVVDNKPGAAGRLGVEEVKRATPGSAMLVTPASTLTMYPHVYRQLAYDPFVDLVPVSTVATTAFALAVGSQVPPSVTSVQELVGWCRQQGASATCGNPGAGSMPHFMTLLLARELGVPLTPVPYRGGQVAMQGAAAGETAMALATESSARALQQARKLRVLATTWNRRSPFFPDSPSFSEAGVRALTQREWFGAFMPARTADAQVRLVAEAIAASTHDADVRDTWERTGLVVEVQGPAALRDALRAEHDFWGPVVRASGFTPEG
jgi:tripartite-type tricarboxylate transporter receptor subunit TctC